MTQLNLDLPEPELPDGGLYPNWENDSLAVIACDDKGNGCVLWTVGPHVRFEMQEGGLRQLDDLGLDDAPLGISVWVGKYLMRTVSYYDGPEYESDAVGHFRPPTAAEWEAIREGQSPWTEEARCRQ